jgi:hypothetical protein
MHASLSYEAVRMTERFVNPWYFILIVGIGGCILTEVLRLIPRDSKAQDGALSAIYLPPKIPSELSPPVLQNEIRHKLQRQAFRRR